MRIGTISEKSVFIYENGKLLNTDSNFPADMNIFINNQSEVDYWFFLGNTAQKEAFIAQRRIINKKNKPILENEKWDTLNITHFLAERDIAKALSFIVNQSNLPKEYTKKDLFFNHFPFKTNSIIEIQNSNLKRLISLDIWHKKPSNHTHLFIQPINIMHFCFWLMTQKVSIPAIDATCKVSAVKISELPKPSFHHFVELPAHLSIEDIGKKEVLEQYQITSTRFDRLFDLHFFHRILDRNTTHKEVQVTLFEFDKTVSATKLLPVGIKNDWLLKISHHYLLTLYFHYLQNQKELSLQWHKHFLMMVMREYYLSQYPQIAYFNLTEFGVRQNMEDEATSHKGLKVQRKATRFSK